MNEPERMVDRARRPRPERVAEWIGPRSFARWSALIRFIDANYPRVFDVEWLFGGQKHGWTLRFKKSKSFCTLVPERGRFKVLLVFGVAEREKVEGVLATLASHVREDYQKATTYHDGRWVLVTVDSARALADVERLLAMKRRPRPARRA
jgi:hypothetical protein